MAAPDDAGCYDRRSRSPTSHPPWGWSQLRKGHAVQFFVETDLAGLRAPYVCAMPLASRCPRLLKSHGWMDGTLHAAFPPESFDPAQSDTWPLVLPRHDLLFADRYGQRQGSLAAPRRVHVEHIREPSSVPPRLSLVLVRWAGEHAIGAGQEGDGGWGKFGCPPSDAYMSALVETGVGRHPMLGGKDGHARDFEIFSLFVRSTHDVWNIVQLAPWIAGSLKGRKKTCFWMIWPAEWEDTGHEDYAGYVDRQALFNAMRACEGAGLSSGFPHSADIYEWITSKTWMASLSLHPRAQLPAAALVSKQSVLANARRAAGEALAALNRIRALNPFPAGGDEPPAPSLANKDGVQKGVVKLGWSWEGRYVAAFTGEEQLARSLTEMLTYTGCFASTCIVQEWVDFDFEMRLYFLPPQDWTPTLKIVPQKFECNAWAGFSEEGRPHSFRKLNEAACLSRWGQDAEALASARAQAVEVSQYLLAWLLTMDARPVPMIRLDFMVRRIGPGKARVIFGEYCEMGACCLAWEDGPPTIWRAALDSALS